MPRNSLESTRTSFTRVGKLFRFPKCSYTQSENGPIRGRTIAGKPADQILIPVHGLEWACRWLVYWLSGWAFLEVLEYVGTLSVFFAVISYFAESGDRIKQKHYQAWQVINTAQGKGGAGGRIDALEELDEDKVPLVGVNVSDAFLQGLDLHGAELERSNFSSADIRGGNFKAARLEFANLASANIRNGNFQNADLANATLQDADLNGANLGRRGPGRNRPQQSGPAKRGSKKYQMVQDCRSQIGKYLRREKRPR